MKNDEMVSHANAYESAMADSRNAQSQHRYRNCVEAAVKSWEHFDGAYQYFRKQGHIDSMADSFAPVLRYAPLLFDRNSLNELQLLADRRKRADKEGTARLSQNVEEARIRLKLAHQLWTYIEDHPDITEIQLQKDLNIDQATFHSITQDWLEMNVIRRQVDGAISGLSLTTRLGEIVRGKCSRCGDVEQAPKALFLEPMDCPRCRNKVTFVLLAEQLQTPIKG
jgi:hypothetical protein